MQKLPLNFNQLFWKLLCEVRFEVTMYRYGREKDWSKPWLHVGYLIQGTESRIPDCLGFPYMGWNDLQTGEDTLSAFWAWWQFAVILPTRRELRPAILFTSCLFRSSFSVRVVHSFYPHLISLTPVSCRIQVFRFRSRRIMPSIMRSILHCATASFSII